MTYALDINLALGIGQVGIADLRAQLVDTAGVDVGTEVSAGFTEIGNGNYLFHYASWPNSHRGGVKFYSDAAGPSDPLAFVAINPQETENPDVKTSTVSGGGGGSVAWPYTVLDSSEDPDAPIEGVWVRVTAAGDTQVLQSGYTDENGIVTFHLDPGTYDFYSYKDGYTFSNPDSEAVS
jgi:hypothetical protein